MTKIEEFIEEWNGKDRTGKVLMADLFGFGATQGWYKSESGQEYQVWYALDWGGQKDREMFTTRESALIKAVETFISFWS